MDMNIEALRNRLQASSFQLIQFKLLQLNFLYQDLRGALVPSCPLVTPKVSVFDNILLMD